MDEAGPGGQTRRCARAEDEDQGEAEEEPEHETSRGAKQAKCHADAENSTCKVDTESR